MTGATLRRILRFTLAELLVGSVFAGAVVGYFVLVYYGDTSFEPVEKSSGKKMAGHVRQAVFQAPDTLFVLVFKHLRFLTSAGEHIDYVYRIDLGTGKAEVVASKLVTYGPDETHGGFNELFVSADGKRLGLPNHDLHEMELRDVDSGKLISTYNIHNLHPARAFVFSPRGEVYSPLLHVYEKSEFPYPDKEHHCQGLVEILPDNVRAVCIVEGTVYVRGFPHGHELFFVNQPVRKYSQCSVSGDGKLMIVSGAESPAPQVRKKWRGAIWKSSLVETATGQLVGNELENYGFSPRFVFDEDGRTVAVKESIPNFPNETAVLVWDRLGKLYSTLSVSSDVSAIALPVRGKVLLAHENGKIEFKRYATTNEEIIVLCVAAGALLLLVALRLKRGREGTGKPQG